MKSAVGTAVGSGLLAMAVSPLMLVLAPFIFIVAFRIIRGREARDVFEEVCARARADLARALGRAPVHADFGAAPSGRSGGIVATGLAYDGERLYAIEESVAEPIPWSSVRRFRWSIETDRSVQVDILVHGADPAYVPDFGARADAAAARTASAMRQSGFFLHVADVGRPVRHFVTSDRAVLERWYEILTQMKEGRLPVA